MYVLDFYFIFSNMESILQIIVLFYFIKLLRKFRNVFSGIGWFVLQNISACLIKFQKSVFSKDFYSSTTSYKITVNHLVINAHN